MRILFVLLSVFFALVTGEARAHARQTDGARLGRAHGAVHTAAAVPFQRPAAPAPRAARVEAVAEPRGRQKPTKLRERVVTPLALRGAPRSFPRPEVPRRPAEWRAALEPPPPRA